MKFSRSEGEIDILENGSIDVPSKGSSFDVDLDEGGGPVGRRRGGDELFGEDDEGLDCKEERCECQQRMKGQKGKG